MTKVACSKCGALILEATAHRNAGHCMPCKTGTRESIEAAKLHYKRERELDRTDPFRKLWQELVHRVHRTECGYEGLSDAEKKYFAVVLVEGEVHNGGFDQYFFNHSAEYYADAELGLEEMGAAQALALLRRAKQVLFDFEPVPTNTTRRRAMLRDRESPSRTKRLEELDALFGKDPDGLAARVEAFVKAHSLA